MKFKVGDHITIVYHGYGHPKSGQSGTIIEETSTAFRIKFDDGDIQNWGKSNSYFEHSSIHHSPLYNELK